MGELESKENKSIYICYWNLMTTVNAAALLHCESNQVDGYIF